MNRYRVINQNGEDYGEFTATSDIAAISEAMYLHATTTSELKNIMAGQINKEEVSYV